MLGAGKKRKEVVSVVLTALLAKRLKFQPTKLQNERSI